MIAHFHHLIFIHVPKCAGMSVEAALGGLPGRQRPEQHATSRELRERYPSEWEAYHRFAVVRHPVDRCRSFVAFYRSYDPIWRRHLSAVDDDRLLRDLLFSHNMLTRYTPARMLIGDEEILKFEELRESWPEFAQRHGLPRELPHRNRSSVPRAGLSRVIPHLIAAMFPEDFERFGYAWPDGASALTLAERGAVCWAELHAWTRRLPDDWSTEAARAAEAWLVEWRARLPDPSWIARFEQLLATRPPDLSGARQLSLWAEHVHDDVNRAIGKPVWEPWSAD